MNKEIWKPIEGYEGLYEVSNYGRIKSLKRKVFVKKKNIYKTVNERILKPNKNTHGYYSLFLSKNGMAKIVTVHSLVANAFISNPNNYPQINHKDEDKSNNNAENLEWCTCKYNINYGTHNIRVKEKNKGKKNPRAREIKAKKVFQYDINNNLIKVWECGKDCEKFGFSNSKISDCCNKKRKTHKGYKWYHEPLEEVKYE